MNKKRIRTHLQRVFDNWVQSIKNPEVAQMVRNNTIITGGAIASLLKSEPPKDYDIYFRNKETTLRVAQYYVDWVNGDPDTQDRGHKAFVLDGDRDIDEQIREVGQSPWNSVMLSTTLPGQVKVIIRSDGVAGTLPVPEDQFDTMEDIPEEILDPPSMEGEPEKEKYRPIFLTSNAITLSDRIQLIIRFYGEPEELHKTYDFIHCCNYWCSWEPGVVSLNPESLESLMNKELIYRGSLYPICSLFRMRKFLSRGWKINAGQILKISFQISDLDLTSIEVLNDQLIGVDTLYFAHFIDQLVKAKENFEKEGKEFKITTGYLETIIDRIFG